MKDAAERTLRQHDLYLWCTRAERGDGRFRTVSHAGRVVFSCAVKVCNGSMKVHVVKYKV